MSNFWDKDKPAQPNQDTKPKVNFWEQDKPATVPEQVVQPPVVKEPVVAVEQPAPVAAAPSVADAFKFATPNDQLLPPGTGPLPPPQMRGIGGGVRQLGQSLNPQAQPVGQWESLFNSALSSWYGKDMASAENDFHDLLARETELEESISNFLPLGDLPGPAYPGQKVGWTKPNQDATRLAALNQELLDVRAKIAGSARKTKDEMEKTMSGIEGRTSDVQRFQAAANKEDIAGAARVLKGDYGTNTGEVAINMAAESAWPSIKGAGVDV
jgi:hypothetical protein